MKRRDVINVYAENMQVGTLAMYDRYRAAFEYTDQWIAGGYSISPLSLPLVKKVFIPKQDNPFDGLFGVFYDSLPDGWGRLLVDRMLRKDGVNPDEITAVQRLAIVGDSGRGLLSYRPAEKINYKIGDYSYDELASEAAKILQDKTSNCLDDMFAMGGSSGGARPKILTEIDGESWIVKFRLSQDPEDMGEIEYRYNECAEKCGIEVPEYRLLPSGNCAGYFACKRFDRHGAGTRIHMATVSALLEVSHRIPVLDYNTFMQLTLKLTRNYAEVEKMFRLMCFNVYAHNRDDHSNNFSFIYSEDGWHVSPAYDLTYSSSVGGEHATTVNGNGSNPGTEDVLAVAQQIGLPMEKAKKTAIEIKENVDEMLLARH